MAEMIIDITKLRSNFSKSIDIDKYIENIKDNLNGTDILEIKDLSVKGYIDKDLLDEYHIELKIEATLMLECSITLKPVEYPVSIDVDGNFEDLLDEYGENLKNITNLLDIWPIVWHNVLLVVPMKVVSPGANLELTKGEGWEVIKTNNEEEV